MACNIWTHIAALHLGIDPEDVTEDQRQDVKRQAYAEMYSGTPTGRVPSPGPNIQNIPGTLAGKLEMLFERYPPKGRA